MIIGKGLYQLTRLSIGLCAAPSSFQKISSDMLDGFQGSLTLLDDIIVVASDDADYYRELDDVLHRVFKYSATIIFDKRTFD